MISFLFSVSVPSTFIVILAFFILHTTASSSVFALPSLTSEPHRRSLVLGIMATFSPVAVTGISFLAIGLSYALLRLFLILKPRLLSSAATTTLPQPVSAGRTSALSFRSPFSFFRDRQKSTTVKPTRARSHRSLLSALYRRLTRPSSPLHLSESDVLPIAMPDSSAGHSFLDLPILSSSSHIPVVKNHGHIFQTRQISRSSSMDSLPSYKPLTPVPILAPVTGRISSPPATPSPTSKSLPGMEDADIPLIPITPPKHKGIPQVPATTLNAGGINTPPPAGPFPAISLSPFKPNNSTSGQSSNAVAGTRPPSPKPNLFLTSRTLSSLSLSPRSLSMQQSKRGKGLGGVTVKRISPPPFEFGQQELRSEPARDIANTQTGSMSAEVMDVAKASTQLVSFATSPPRFLLNFSSPASSPVSDCSSTFGLLSSSPSNSYSDTTPTSLPLTTASRTTSHSSNSSDLAKPLDHRLLIPRPIPLVDVDTSEDADINGLPGFEMNQRVPEWSFDAEEPGNTELLFADFDNSSSAISGSPVKRNRNEVEKELIQLDDELVKSDAEQQGVGEESRWGWDDDLEDHGSWDVKAPAELDSPHPGPGLEDDEAASECQCDGPDLIDPVLPSSVSTLAEELDDGYEPDADIKYPDPDLVPLPETINELPSIFMEADYRPVVSVCTQPAALFRRNSNDDSDISSGSSLVDSASPISLVQTPTPPASPPRDVRVAFLLTPADLDSDGLATTSDILSTSECLSPVDMKSIQDRFRASSVPLIGTETSPPSTDVLPDSTEEVKGLEDEPRFFEDQRFCHSPECISDSDDDIAEEFTLNIEAASDDDSDDDSDRGGVVDIVMSLPDGSDDGCEESTNIKEVVLQCPEGRLQIGKPPGVDCPVGEEGVAVAPSEEKPVQAVVTMAEISVESEMDAHLAHNLPSHAKETIQDEVASSSVATPVLEQPHTLLPGTFPDVKLSLKTERVSEPQSQAPNSSVPPPTNRRRRSPLEEAIARTRSPLEVALAMQLRPGLGLGADPAWMVRFMMVMWGWMFGVVLMPTAET